MAYYISSGKVSSGIILNNNYMYISSGGIANNTMVNSRGDMYISAGGVANSTTINSRGFMYIFSGGTANSTTVNSRGNMYISSGGTANHTTVNWSGYMYISSGGVANSTTVNYDGYMCISSGGVANSTTVNYDGYMCISSGGVANSTTVNGGGYNYGRMYIFSGGVANSTTVNDWGDMYISSGGTANNTTVNSGGSMRISSGGVANSTTVYSGASMYISSGGTADLTTVNDWGTMYIYSGGTALNITWTPCIGYVSAEDGAYVTYTSKYSGVYFGSDNQLLSHTQIMDNKIVSGSMYVMSGGVVNSTTVNDWGDMYILAGGTANRTTVNSSGYMYISSGGVANSTTVNSRGSIYISSGGVANSTTVNGGFMYISFGGTANSTTVNDWSWMYISSGGTANRTTVNSGGWMNIYSSGTALEIKENGGYVGVYDGANVTFASNTINGLTISRSMTVHKNTIANRTTMSYCDMYISSGGVANSTTVNSGGIMHISSGGVANRTTVNRGGLMWISSGGTASIVFNPWQGNIVSSAGAVVTYLERDKNIYYGGYNSGLVSKWDNISDFEITSGNSMLIYSGGVANSTTVNSRGWMNISSGGKHTGFLQIANGAVVCAYKGAVIDFYVADRTANDGYLINDLSLISGTPTYTITVSAEQSDGTYKLAQGAESFTGSIFIGNGTVTYGSITVNGEDFVYNNTTYSLNQVNGNLTLTVKKQDIIPPEMPTVSADFTEWTNQNVTVSAVFSEDSALKQYSINNGEWMTYVGGVVMENNGTVAFRGIDAAGNISDIANYEVTNIDKVAPTLDVTGNATEWTNKDVVLTANVSDGVVEYFDGKNWVAGSTLTVSENGTYQFRVTDEAGNVTEKSVIVDKIDKVAPTLEVSGNATAWTNQDVILTANVSDGVVEYFDGENWVAGSTLTVSENGTYQFRVTDLAGNVTTKEVVVDKIDKVAPTLEVTGNATAWTNQDVILTAVVSDGVVEYFDGENWITGSTLTATENGTYQFRVTDLAGNVTTKEIVVDKIDKVAPTLDVTGNAENWTNNDVILTANVSDGVVEYFDNGEWIIGNSLTVSENGTYTFRVTDEAGNITEKSVIVDKIDKVAPTLEVSGNAETWTNKDVILTANVSDGVVEYFDGKNWIAGSTLTATENGTYQFRVTDEAGNVTEKSVVVNKIDKVSPTLEVSGNATAWTNQDVILTANASDGVVEYFDNGEWIIGNSLTVSENGTYQFKVTDEAGNVTEKSIEVTFIDKDAPVISEISADITELTNSAIKVYALFNDSNNFSVQYRINDGAWLDYNDYIIMENNGIVYFKAEDIAGNVTEAQYIVSNIDRTTAEAPVITVEKRAYLSNNPLIVTAEFAENAVTKEYSFNGIDWISYAEQVIVRENGFIFFRSCDAIGNYSVVGKAEVSGIDHVADSSLTDYVFVKSNYTEKNTKNKKQNGIMLTFSENAFNTLADFEHSAAYKVVMLDNNINIFAATDLSDLSVISGVAAVPTVKKKVNSYSYSAKANARGTLNIIEKNTDDVLFKDFANVNIYGNAIAGIVDGGKSANSQTIKTSVKKAVTTVIETNKVSQTASGKANVNGAFVKTLSNYATVNIESGTVENIVNNAYKLTKTIKNVGGNNSEIKYTEQFTASGTVKLTNGAHTDTISNYKTVKITDSNVGKIESFAVSKIVNGAENRKLAGSVTLLRASVDTIENYAKLTMTDSVAAAVANVRKIAVNKGFSSIENYIGTSENDTLTIGKNAVLVLSGANFGIGSDKIVNSGTLIFASDFVLNAEKITNKGNFAATSDVWENLNGKIVGLLNLGQTYEGFRNIKYELADNTAKKAVKWDLKSDYTGWLSGDSDCIDTVDFVKFKTGKESSMIEISGFSGSDTISLVDKKGNVAELTFADGVFKAELAAKTDYILELGISKGDDSMSYTLAVG